MERAEYVKLLQDLLSRDPVRVREANAVLYTHVVEPSATVDDRKREADIVLAEIAG